MTDLAALRRLLAAQEAKPVLESSSRQIIASLKPEIQRLHKDLGWSWLDIAALLGQQGVTVSVNTLRNYVYTAEPSRRAAAVEAAPRRAKRRPADAAAGDRNAPTAPAAPAAGESPFPRPALPITGRVNPILD